MPTEVIRDNISYLEYTPQEIAQKRLDELIADMLKRGQYRQSTSNIEETQERNHRRRRE